jgi:hypothetical protein
MDNTRCIAFVRAERTPRAFQLSCGRFVNTGYLFGQGSGFAGGTDSAAYVECGMALLGSLQQGLHVEHSQH